MKRAPARKCRGFSVLIVPLRSPSDATWPHEDGGDEDPNEEHKDEVVGHWFVVKVLLSPEQSKKAREVGGPERSPHEPPTPVLDLSPQPDEHTTPP